MTGALYKDIGISSYDAMVGGVDIIHEPGYERRLEAD
jgi:hypothetical protein